MKTKKYNLSGFQITEIEETPSTNTLAAESPYDELHDKDVILTFRQTKGRGQIGNKWESAPEQNISMTIVFKPAQLSAGKQFAISMIIALGCRDFINHYLENCSIKWPNDIYVDHRKIAGILIEHNIAGTRICRSLCGIGLNVNQPEFHSDAPNPVSLLQLTGKELPLIKVVEDLLHCIDKRYEQINEYEQLETDFLQHLYRREGLHQWKDKNGNFQASIAGIDEYGRLRLKTPDNRFRLYGFKEVSYLQT